jgi:hypothetical protein
MSRALVKEQDVDNLEELPERPISEHPNNVTEAGLAQIDSSEVRFGASVTIARDDGRKQTFRSSEKTRRTPNLARGAHYISRALWHAWRVGKGQEPRPWPFERLPFAARLAPQGGIRRTGRRKLPAIP